MISKLSPAVTHLDAILVKPGIEFVAGPIKDPVLAALTRFKELDTLCKSVVFSEGRSKVHLPDLKDVSCEIADNRKASAFVATMLANIARAGR